MQMADIFVYILPAEEGVVPVTYESSMNPQVPGVILSLREAYGHGSLRNSSGSTIPDTCNASLDAGTYTFSRTRTTQGSVCVALFAIGTSWQCIDAPASR